jgi:hypothetical protein
MTEFLAAFVTAPVVAITLPSLQAWLESRDFDKHRND